MKYAGTFPGSEKRILELLKEEKQIQVDTKVVNALREFLISNELHGSIKKTGVKIRLSLNLK